MKIVIPCDWKVVDLLTTDDPNDFGEALRNYCFVGNITQTGCYSTFDVIKHLKKVKKGEIFEEAKKELYDDIIPTIYHFKLKEKDCYVAKYKICEPYEIVCGWSWDGDGDGSLYFRFNNRKVINTDCKCDYCWEWIK